MWPHPGGSESPAQWPRRPGIWSLPWAPFSSPSPQPLIITTLPTASPHWAELHTSRIWWGVGGSFPRNGPVSHQPAQEVAASCPAS